MALTVAANAITFSDSTALSSGNIQGAQIIPGTITSDRIANNSITFDKVEAGNIIQAHQFGMNLRAFYAINANPSGFTALPAPTYNQTGLVVSGSFNPKSASSRIFITCVMHFTTDIAPNVVMSLWRTPGLVVGVNPVLVSATKVAPTGANYGQVAIIECTDTPNTTGPLIYELKVASGGGAMVYVNGYNSTEFQIPGLAPQTYYRTGVTLLEVKN